MTAIVEGDQGFFLGAAAKLIDVDREVATEVWYAKHLTASPTYSWIVGRFVEAGAPNKNGHLFSLEGLQANRPSIEHAPMNINHNTKRIVGTFTAAEMMYPIAAPTTASVDDVVRSLIAPNASPGYSNAGSLSLTATHAGLQIDTSLATPVVASAVNPHIEALGVVWKQYNPAAYAEIELAYAEGRAALSMECVPRKLRCAGDDGCNQEFAYMGRRHDTYCAHLNEGGAVKELIDPHFVGGAVVTPPEVPAWPDADIYSLVAAQHAASARPVPQTPDDWQREMDRVLGELESGF